MAEAKLLTEAQRRAMHNGYSAYVTNSDPEAAEWELWQAACEWAWKNSRRSLGSAATYGVQPSEQEQPK